MILSNATNQQMLTVNFDVFGLEALGQPALTINKYMYMKYNQIRLTKEWLRSKLCTK